MWVEIDLPFPTHQTRLGSLSHQDIAESFMLLPLSWQHPLLQHFPRRGSEWGGWWQERWRVTRAHGGRNRVTSQGYINSPVAKELGQIRVWSLEASECRCIGKKPQLFPESTGEAEALRTYRPWWVYGTVLGPNGGCSGNLRDRLGVALTSALSPGVRALPAAAAATAALLCGHTRALWGGRWELPLRL